MLLPKTLETLMYKVKASSILNNVTPSTSASTMHQEKDILQSKTKDFYEYEKMKLVPGY
jgi:hypothetical protein